jgi:hypothetical protein
MALHKNETGYLGDVEDVHKAFTEILDRQIETQRKCLNMAYDAVRTFVNTPISPESPPGFVAKEPGPMFEVIEKHLGRPMTEDEKQDCAFGIVTTFRDGYSGCDIWTIAHNFEHEFFDDQIQAPPKDATN